MPDAARMISPAGADRQAPPPGIGEDVTHLMPQVGEDVTALMGGAASKGAWSGPIGDTLIEGGTGFLSGALSVVNPMTYVRGMQAKADANRQDYEDFKAGRPRGSREHRVGIGEAISTRDS